MIEHGGVALADRRELTEEQWLLARKTGIGGSDIAAIMGLSKYASPLTVYLDKTTDDTDRESSLAAELGLELEPFIARKFSGWMKEHEGAEIEVEGVPHILVHPEHDYFIANVDGALWHPGKSETGGFEAKTGGEFTRDDWKEGELPDAYYAQVQWYMGITDWPWFYIAGLIGNRTLEVRFIPRNDEVIGKLHAEAERFWFEHVIAKVPPAPIGLAADTDALKMLYPEASDRIINCDHMADIYDELKALARVKKETKARQEQLQQIFMAEMGDAEIAVIGKGKCTWKVVEKKAYEVKASSSRQFRVY